MSCVSAYQLQQMAVRRHARMHSALWSHGQLRFSRATLHQPFGRCRIRTGRCILARAKRSTIRDRHRLHFVLCETYLFRRPRLSPSLQGDVGAITSTEQPSGASSFRASLTRVPHVRQSQMQVRAARGTKCAIAWQLSQLALVSSRVLCRLSATLGDLMASRTVTRNTGSQNFRYELCSHHQVIKIRTARDLRSC